MAKQKKEGKPTVEAPVVDSEQTSQPEAIVESPVVEEQPETPVVGEGALPTEPEDKHVFTPEDIANASMELPVERDVYWTCGACETDTRKYRDGYHHVPEFDEGHVGENARDMPVCSECGDSNMQFHAQGTTANEVVYDLEHQCWRHANGTVFHPAPDAKLEACPFCSTSGVDTGNVSPTGLPVFECTHCNILFTGAV